MGKQGPCHHCGATSTPLWRNGPPEKPVLCNACGSRWRTKGSLVNYTPLHSRLDGGDHEDHRVAKLKTLSLKKKEENRNKRKLHYENITDGGFVSDCYGGFQKNLDEDLSNRSSSGSAVSNTESCARFGSVDTSDFTGPAHSNAWDTVVPSRKRTCVTRPKQSSVEKLTKDLCTILHEQQSSFSESSEEDLLFESETPMVSVEFGHGSILIKHPSSNTREEESETSSLSVENKLHLAHEDYSNFGSFCARKAREIVDMSFQEVDKVKKLSGQMVEPEQVKRNKTNYEKLQNLWNHNSPLCHIDLSEVVNLEVFRDHLTADEQRYLLKYLPLVDTSILPDGLTSMFASPFFKESMSSFQRLLAEEIFDTSSPGAKPEDCKILKRLVLSNATKSKWVEQYHLLKDERYKDRQGECVVSSKDKPGISKNPLDSRRPHDSQNHHLPEVKIKIKNPKGAFLKDGSSSKEHLQNEGSCFSSRNFLALPNDRNTLLYLTNENYEEDLLLDVPSNGSFPQAELLHSVSSSVHPTLIR